MKGLTQERRSIHLLDTLESNVRSYSRLFPAIFSRARGSIMLTEEGKKVIDFFSGAGVLNYGHNNHGIKAAITEYLSSDALALQLLLLRASESMGNHDSNVVGAGRVG
ncbi:hypothetical protein [Bradyrhizobium sp. 168]|uniref:hypothetical protein n=1 Tax=Bradyrhizobium sp. 168 TaxID=2782639 RepID=UPI001FF83BF3|nr:hypothetical protein [Bradyrhizobium sp. 168]